MYKNFKVFDTHVHVFPEKIAVKAAKNIGAFYDIPMSFDGTFERARALAEEKGVDMCLIHSVATTAAQTHSINTFISDCVNTDKEHLIGFCSVHPDLGREKLREEIDYAVSLGLKGIKLHPDFQRFNIDDRAAYDIYEIAEEKGLPILFHTGDKRYHFSSPNRLAKVLESFSELTVIGAHFGGWSEWDEGERFLAGRKNVYVDTSSSFYAISPEKAKEYIEAFGVDKILFGSDYPMWSVGSELVDIINLGLSEEDTKKILWGNAEKLYLK